MKNLLLLFIVAVLFSFNGLSAAGVPVDNWVCVVKSNDQAIVDQAEQFALLFAALRPGSSGQSTLVIDGAGVIEYDITNNGSSLLNGSLKGGDNHFLLFHGLSTALETGKKGVLDPPVGVPPYSGIALTLHGNDIINYQLPSAGSVALDLQGYAEISCSGSASGGGGGSGT